MHRNRSGSLYTHKNLQGFAYSSSDKLLLLKTTFFRMESLISPTILKLQHCGLFSYLQNLLLYKCHGLNFAILECYGKYAQTFGKNVQFKKIYIYTKKKQAQNRKMYSETFVDYEILNTIKKETLFYFQNCTSYNQFKNCPKIKFSLNNSFSMHQIKKIHKQMCLKILFYIYIPCFKSVGLIIKKFENCGSLLKGDGSGNIGKLHFCPFLINIF